mgnify:CR=1 FL=1
MSQIEVDKVIPQSGTALQVGENGDTITVPSGTTLNLANATVSYPNGSVQNNDLANFTITINGSSVSLGGSVTITTETKPTITGINPTVITNSQTAVTITGTNFVSVPTVDAISTTGAIFPADAVTFTSATSIEATFTLANDGTYFIRVENNDGNAVRSSSALLNVSDAPSWTTNAGSLGTFAGNFSGTIATLAATGDTPITFSETTNVLTNAAQANCSLSTAGVISTTDFGGSSTSPTTYSFTIRATDAQNQTTDRNFTLTSTYTIGLGGRFDG